MHQGLPLDRAGDMNVHTVDSNAMDRQLANALSLSGIGCQSFHPLDARLLQRKVARVKTHGRNHDSSIMIPYAYFVYAFTGEREAGNILLREVLRDLVNNFWWEIENREDHIEDGQMFG